MWILSQENRFFLLQTNSNPVPAGPVSFALWKRTIFQSTRTGACLPSVPKCGANMETHILVMYLTMDLLPPVCVTA